FIQRRFGVDDQLHVFLVSHAHLDGCLNSFKGLHRVRGRRFLFVGRGRGHGPFPASCIFAFFRRNLPDDSQGFVGTRSGSLSAPASNGNNFLCGVFLPFYFWTPPKPGRPLFAPPTPPPFFVAAAALSVFLNPPPGGGFPSPVALPPPNRSDHPP